jgi:hypothetical protein
MIKAAQRLYHTFYKERIPPRSIATTSSQEHGSERRFDSDDVTPSALTQRHKGLGRVCGSTADRILLSLEFTPGLMQLQ